MFECDIFKRKFGICWIESFDLVADLCLTNQIYSVLLNAFKSKEITEVQNGHLKTLLEDGENNMPRQHSIEVLKFAMSPSLVRSHVTFLANSAQAMVFRVRVF